MDHMVNYKINHKVNHKTNLLIIYHKYIKTNQHQMIIF